MRVMTYHQRCTPRLPFMTLSRLPGMTRPRLPTVPWYITRIPGKIYVNRQSYPLPRSPCSSCGPSPPVDTPRLRLGGLNPASPADPTGPASSSPPLSDFGMDLGHSSVPTIQIASNVPPPLGRGSRSSSFCAGGGGSGGASLGFGEHGGGDGIIPGLPGLSVRGHPSGSGDYVSLERCGTYARLR